MHTVLAHLPASSFVSLVALRPQDMRVLTPPAVPAALCAAVREHGPACSPPGAETQLVTRAPLPRLPHRHLPQAPPLPSVGTALTAARFTP